jgi:hypothetical protein
MWRFIKKGKNIILSFLLYCMTIVGIWHLGKKKAGSQEFDNRFEITTIKKTNIQQ